eukprot:GGOE01007308.1.p1 GENE.GGOE01007308.1~~GGOE01007308.1.p1  ORF type:complete len:605 (+),score=194.89 GGOE01007308.1:64-1878(+)
MTSAHAAMEDVPNGEEWLRRARSGEVASDIGFTAIPSHVDDLDQDALPLHQAVKDANLTNVLLLLKRLPRSSLMEASPDGYTPLHVIAAVADPTPTHMEIALALVKALPKEAFAATDEEGNTPLHIACTIGAVAMVTLIFHHSPEAVRVARNLTQGATPLHLSIYQGTNVAANAFLIHQLPYEALLIPDDEGNRPLEAAREEEDLETAELLARVLGEHGLSDTGSPRAESSASNTVSRPESQVPLQANGDGRPPPREKDPPSSECPSKHRSAAEKEKEKKKWAVTKAWDEVINLIIRPRRHIYLVSDLGPTKFHLHGGVFHREDIVVANGRGQKLQCSWFLPHNVTEKVACVISCHGNAGSRCFALDMIRHLLPCNISVFTFDFAGCGLSEGEYVSLGYYEKGDLEAVVNYLEGTTRVSRIGVWGRSMGAATAIMYAAVHTTVSAICCDSPFASLYQVMVDLVKTRKKWVPEAAVKIATKQIRKSIRKRAHFDIKQLNTLEFARQCTVPCILAHATGDDFILPTHHLDLAHAYQGPFQAITFPGDHGSARPPEFYDAVKCFFLVHLTPDSPHAAGLSWTPTRPGNDHEPHVVLPSNLCVECCVQ